ncbi:hypothetical protein AAJ76_8400010531 [Vairimorpha ceranae]|uniref:Uncharacterized protein n=1 Tax=Vairimorpha ceranae TaxID=40302 RepID=A0A0F9WMN4_9MICR|nr:hypothetical protein AAJ76_8400010531 [Vairimorpha ceranae]KKO74318.1 hypothetical protein AAJ76_8400010531 [Vairimorpha ceranae]
MLAYQFICFLNHPNISVIFGPNATLNASYKPLTISHSPTVIFSFKK